MKLCVKCKKEMICTKTGKGVLYSHGHYYPGDEYTCPQCGARVIVTNPTPIHLDVEPQEEHVRMEE